jgi:deazaflavin-dependent oxidoreductase (nitroreductase family)
MPMPKAMARINRVATNRITRPLLRRLPGFGVVVHHGRRSGRRYETPVNVFRMRPGVRIALTYGRDSVWVKNVVAAGGCTVVTRGRELALTAPQITHDPSRAGARLLERPMLALLHVDDFLDLRET